MFQGDAVPPYNASSGALDNPMWVQGNNEKLQGTEPFYVTLDNTRSSPHLSVVTLGCFKWKRREGRRTGLPLKITWPQEAQDVSCVIGGVRERLCLNVLGGDGSHQRWNKGMRGEGYCLDSEIKSGLRDICISQELIYSSEQSMNLSLYRIESQILMGLAQKG